MSTSSEPQLAIEIADHVATIRIARPAKRNALSDKLVAQLKRSFEELPAEVNAVVLHGEGDHFCAGLDLSELKDHDVFGGIEHSRMWHSAFERVQFGRVPVVSVLCGAVVGGGLELACSTHVRVAEPSAFYALPEGQRGLFVGGGGSVRIPRIIGFSRMTDLMLTGRVLTADEGQQLGLSHYLVGPGEGLARAQELARRIATNAPLSNYAVMHALPRIASQPMEDGFFMEALMAAITQSDPAAKERMRAFLEKRASKVGDQR